MHYYTTGNEDFQYYVIPTQSLQSRAPGTWARPSQQFYSPIEPSQAKVSRTTRLYHQAPESVGELVWRNTPSVNQYHEFSRLWENYSAISHHDSTELQSQKIAIKAALDHENPMSNACSLYRLSLDMNNKFSKPTKYVFHEGRETSFWMHIIDTKVRRRLNVYQIGSEQNSAGYVSCTVFVGGVPLQACDGYAQNQVMSLYYA